jgi:hypothetical protein
MAGRDDGVALPGGADEAVEAGAVRFERRERRGFLTEEDKVQKTLRARLAKAEFQYALEGVVLSAMYQGQEEFGNEYYSVPIPEAAKRELAEVRGNLAIGPQQASMIKEENRDAQILLREFTRRPITGGIRGRVHTPEGGYYREESTAIDYEERVVRAKYLCRAVAREILYNNGHFPGRESWEIPIEAVDGFAKILGDPGNWALGSSTRGRAEIGLGSNLAFVKSGWYMDTSNLGRRKFLAKPGANVYSSVDAVEAPKRIAEMPELAGAAAEYMRAYNREGGAKTYAQITQDLNRTLNSQVTVWWNSRDKSARLYGASDIRRTFVRAPAKTAVSEALVGMGAEDRGIHRRMYPFDIAFPGFPSFIRTGKREASLANGEGFNQHVVRDPSAAGGKGYGLAKGVNRRRVFAVNHRLEKAIREAIVNILNVTYSEEIARVAPILPSLIEEALLHYAERGEFSLVSTNFRNLDIASKVANRVAECIVTRSQCIGADGKYDRSKYEAAFSDIVTPKINARLGEEGNEILDAKRANLLIRTKAAQTFVPKLLNRLQTENKLKALNFDSRVRRDLTEHCFEVLTKDPKYIRLEQQLSKATDTTEIAGAQIAIDTYVDTYVKKYATAMVFALDLRQSKKIRSSDVHLRSPDLFSHTEDVNKSSIDMIGKMALGQSEAMVLCAGGLKSVVDEVIRTSGIPLDDALQDQLRRDLATQLTPLFREGRIISQAVLVEAVSVQLTNVLKDKELNAGKYTKQSIRFFAGSDDSRDVDARDEAKQRRSHYDLADWGDSKWFRNNVAQKLNLSTLISGAARGAHNPQTCSEFANQVFDSAIAIYNRHKKPQTIKGPSNTLAREVRKILEHNIRRHGEIEFTADKVKEMAEALAVVLSYAQVQEADKNTRFFKTSTNFTLNRTSMGYQYNPTRYDDFTTAIGYVGTGQYERAFKIMHDLEHPTIKAEAIKRNCQVRVTSEGVLISAGKKVRNSAVASASALSGARETLLPPDGVTADTAATARVAGRAASSRSLSSGGRRGSDTSSVHSEASATGGRSEAERQRRGSGASRGAGVGHIRR